MTEEPDRVPRDELDDVGIGERVIEGLRRLTHEREVRGVEVYLTDDHDWPWMVRVRAARFLSDEALQDELATRVEDALRAVAGTTEVASRSGGEWWVGWWSVAGTPEGPELIAAAAGVVDELVTQLRSQVAACSLRWDDPELPSAAKRFRDVLLSLSEFEPIGPAERTRALRDALLAFGSETEDNVAAAAVLAVRFGPFGRLVLALEGGPELSDLANQLEGGEVPPQLRQAFPALTQAQWDGFARIVTLIFCALEEP